MVADLVNGYAVLGVYLEQLRDKVLGNARESFGPLDLECKDIAKEIILTLSLERWIAREQLK